MKNPFELIREIEFNNLDNSQKNFRTNISNIENFMLWIVGFTITGIGLIISNIEKLKKEIAFENVQTILVFFIVALFFGIFNRYAIFRLLVLSQSIENFVKLSLSNFDFPEINPENLETDITFEELIDRFRFDYDLDYSRYIEQYSLLNQSDKEKSFEDLKIRYFEIGEFLHKTYKEGLENVRNIYKEAYGLSEQKSRKIFYMEQSTISKKFNNWTYFVDLSYISCTVSFLIAMSILVFGTFCK